MNRPETSGHAQFSYAGNSCSQGLTSENCNSIPAFASTFGHLYNKSSNSIGSSNAKVKAEPVEVRNDLTSQFVVTVPVEKPLCITKPLHARSANKRSISVSRKEHVRSQAIIRSNSFNCRGEARQQQSQLNGHLTYSKMVAQLASAANGRTFKHEQMEYVLPATVQHEEPISPHVLSNSSISHVSASGANRTASQKMLRHASEGNFSWLTIPDSSTLNGVCDIEQPGLDHHQQQVAEFMPAVASEPGVPTIPDVLSYAIPNYVIQGAIVDSAQANPSFVNTTLGPAVTPGTHVQICTDAQAIGYFPSPMPMHSQGQPDILPGVTAPALANTLTPGWLCNPNASAQQQQQPSSQTSPTKLLLPHTTQATSPQRHLASPVKTQRRKREKLNSQSPDNGMVYPKPSFSYSCLIALSLKNSATGCLPVSDIYKFMMENFPYFKTAPSGWKNSVRHNLSLNKCFEKIENPNCKVPGQQSAPITPLSPEEQSPLPASNAPSSGGGGQQKKGCLWTMNPAKVTRMQEEIAKSRKKELASICRAMAHPENLDELERGNFDWSLPLAVASRDNGSVSQSGSGIPSRRGERGSSSSGADDSPILDVEFSAGGVDLELGFDPSDQQPMDCGEPPCLPSLPTLSDGGSALGGRNSATGDSGSTQPLLDRTDLDVFASTIDPLFGDLVHCANMKGDALWDPEDMEFSQLDHCANNLDSSTECTSLDSLLNASFSATNELLAEPPRVTQQLNGNSRQLGRHLTLPHTSANLHSVVTCQAPSFHSSSAAGHHSAASTMMNHHHHLKEGDELALPSLPSQHQAHHQQEASIFSVT